MPRKKVFLGLKEPRNTKTALQLGGGALLLGAFAKLQETTISFVMSVPPSVRMEQLGYHWTNFHEIWYEYFAKIFRKFWFNYNLTRITGTVHEDKYTFLIISRSVFLRMRNILDF
jgi:hypothetical protein